MVNGVVQKLHLPATCRMEMDVLIEAWNRRAIEEKQIDVVFCRECKLQGNCFTEDHFSFAGIKDPFCCVGKRKEGADNEH